MHVLVVEDDFDVARGVRRKLQRRFDALGGAPITVEVAPDLPTGLAQLSAHDDVLGCVIDLGLGGDGLAGLQLVTIARERDADMPLVVFTGRAPSEVAEAVGERLVPFVRKGSLKQWETLTTFADAVHRRANRRTLPGDRTFTEDVATVAGTTPLTPEEAAYLRLAAEGAGDKEASTTLGVPMGTLNNRRTSILRKMGAASMRSAIFRVIRRAYRDL